MSARAWGITLCAVGAVVAAVAGQALWFWVLVILFGAAIDSASKDHYIGDENDPQ